MNMIDLVNVINNTVLKNKASRCVDLQRYKDIICFLFRSVKTFKYVLPEKDTALDGELFGFFKKLTPKVRNIMNRLTQNSFQLEKVAE